MSSTGRTSAALGRGGSNRAGATLALMMVSALTVTGCATGTASDGLPTLRLDPARVAVAGISSGAIMAQQVHLAYADRLRGAALLSGPPYQCAGGTLEQALGQCMAAPAPGPDAAALAQRIVERAGRGELAPLSGLQGDAVLVAHGRHDGVVSRAVARAALTVYENLPQVASMTLRWDGDGDFAHLWPTLDTGGDCTVTAAPYLGNCGRDFAAEVVQTLFGAAAGEADDASGELITFSQAPFNPDGRDALLDDKGYLYVPKVCAAGESCGLLVVFHGCDQGAAVVGDVFARDNGLNRLAADHRLVVLYPQARASYAPLNPKGCWDWWGFSGADYDTRSGAQLVWLAKAVSALGVELK